MTDTPAIIKLLNGCVDLHCHSGPNPFPRRIDHAEAGKDASCPTSTSRAAASRNTTSAEGVTKPSSTRDRYFSVMRARFDSSRWVRPRSARAALSEEASLLLKCISSMASTTAYEVRRNIHATLTAVSSAYGKNHISIRGYEPTIARGRTPSLRLSFRPSASSQPGGQW